jgi:hypothetical protein
MDRFIYERAVALGHALDRSTQATYNSHLQSYLTFCKNHNFSVEPTEDTLSFYTVYMCHYIKPDSVNTYLSGICSSLEQFYPDIRKTRRSRLVAKTLAGCQKLYSSPTKRKEPLLERHLSKITALLSDASSHNDKLFIALTLTGFHALMRLAELVEPRDKSFRKVTLRSTLSFPDSNQYSFWLPTSKSDRAFEGNRILITSAFCSPSENPITFFRSYLVSRDSLFPYHPHLWLMSDGTLPKRNWYISRLKALFPEENIGGHSLRAGGATFLAIHKVPDDRIQAMGRWSSDAFKIYIRKHPALLHTLLDFHSQTETSSVPSVNL